MYSAFVEAQILRLCRQPRSFEFISLNLNGFDPIELFEKLKKLEEESKLLYINNLWCINKKNEGSKIDSSHEAQFKFFNEHIGFFGLFKKPHPLDFEWRNSTGSLNYLINRIQELNDAQDKSLFLGFPTLFATACINDIPQGVTLVEKNEPIIKGLSKLNIDKDRFRIIQADIFTANPEKIGKFHSVIMDPPWYPPHFFQFMWLAAQCVEIGGVVGISLPSINTRPNIADERIEWFSFCQRQGLCLENLYSQKLHYAMPFFEFNAFRAAGVKDILPFWRKGDLAFFRKVNTDEIIRPELKEVQEEWIEREIKNVRIRIRIQQIENLEQELKICSVIKGDIFPMVSTRDERRNQANIWTSGNRIFRVNDTQLFLRLLDNVLAGRSGDGLQVVEEFIDTVIELENNEYNNYLDWLYHEMERQTD